MTKKTFAAFLLFVLTVPAIAAPFALRPEVPVSRPEYGLAGEINRSHPRLASNGDTYLAVWTDFREAGSPTVYAARLAADGTLLDPLGIRVAENAHAGPIVWTGSKYLVTYESEPGTESYVRTMTPEGVFGEPVSIGKSARWGSMATNGTNVLLVLPAQVMLLDLDGNHLKTVPAETTVHQGFQSRVAAAGSTYLIASAKPDVVVQAVSSDGTVSAPLTLEKPTTHTLVGLASDGERFLIVWPYQFELRGQLITKEGTTSGPVHTIAPNIAGYPSAEWRDGEYLVIFSERTLYSHYAVRVAADGSPIGTPKRLPQDYNSETEIVANGRGGIALFGRMQAAVFDDASLAGEEVFRRFVDVAVTARPQRNVRISRLGDGYVVAWAEGGRIMLSNAAGRTPVAVEGSNFALIDVLVDRSNIIWVIWTAYSSERIGISRFWGDLTPVDPAPIYFDSPPGMSSISSIAAGDGVIAVAYELLDVFGHDIATMLLWETGSGIARKDVRISNAEFPDFRPTVTFDGSAFVYAWSHAKGPAPEQYNMPDPEIELVAARVSPAGGLLDAAPVRLADNVGYITKMVGARGANGVAFAWHTDAQSMRMALFGGNRVIELGGAQMRLIELTPHEGGFILLRGLPRQAPALTEVEYLLLGADLSLGTSGSLPPYVGTGPYLQHDVDVIGGPSPVFVYAKPANDRESGNVLRVFVRATGEGPTRRRALR